MSKIRLVELTFEDMLKHDSKVICRHHMLKNKKYEKPMLFNELLANIGTDFGPGNCKSIFSYADWYIETLDSDETLNTIIDMSKYKKTGRIKESIFNIDDAPKSSLSVDDIFKEFNNLYGTSITKEEIDSFINDFNKIDVKVEDIKPSINNFQDIGNIITLKYPADIPVGNILEYLKLYFKENRKIYNLSSRVIGELVTYDNKTITIKLTNHGKILYDGMKHHFVSFIFLTGKDLNTDTTIIYEMQSIIVHEEPTI